MSRLAPFFIILAGVLWGCIGLFVRPLNAAGLHSMEIVAIRAYITSLAMFLILLIYDRKQLIVRIKDIWCFIGTGLCSIVFFNYCYFVCITLTSLSVAAVLLYTAPVIVMLMSFFLFKEALSKKKIVSLVMTFVGCVLVTGVLGDAKQLSLQGIIIGLGAGLGYALYSIFGRYAISKGYSSFTITFYTFLLASVGCLFISDNKALINVMSIDYKLGLLEILFGIVSTVLPYLAYTVGLKYIDNGKAAIIASVEPVTATLLGVFVFKEQISVGGIIGVIFVCVALAICNL